MSKYKTLKEAVQDLKRTGRLIEIKEAVDTDLEMAAIHKIAFEEDQKAVYYKNVSGSKFPAVSNLFASLEQSKYLLRARWKQVQTLIDLKSNPMKALKTPFKSLALLQSLVHMLPKKVKFEGLGFKEVKISDLPAIKSWPMDGGRFITLPQVYSEDVTQPGWQKSNLGMYRVQLDGNDYSEDEIGLHYQIHRGIGVHQAKAKERGEDLKVSIFIGGPPAHTLSAVMPLPEGISELTFAGVLAGRRFRYAKHNGYTVSADADFVICGTIQKDLKPEGPFGDHLGYYSLQHDFPVLKVDHVLAKDDAIWPFTVVGRPPAEDSQFGELIHAITGNAIQAELPGVKAVHAVDVAGVHPLLLAIGSERYTPYSEEQAPMEILTQANAILGFGQLSLAKFLFIIDDPKNQVDIHSEQGYIEYVLERVQLNRDMHFQTCTTIDTLDYSGESVNHGSKLVIAARGQVLRELQSEPPKLLCKLKFGLISKGILAIEVDGFTSYEKEADKLAALKTQLLLDQDKLEGFPLIVLCDDLEFITKNYQNFLWQTFTRANPSHDVYGLKESIKNKHWACETSLIVDARAKPHHAPDLVEDQVVVKRAREILDRA